MRVEIVNEVVGEEDTVWETTLLTVEGDPQWCQRVITWALNYSPSFIFKISDVDEEGREWSKTWTLSDTYS